MSVFTIVILISKYLYDMEGSSFKITCSLDLHSETQDSQDLQKAFFIQYDSRLRD